MTVTAIAIQSGIAGALVGFLAGMFHQFRADRAQISRKREKQKRKMEHRRMTVQVQQQRREIFDALTGDTVRLPKGDDV